MVLIQQTSKFSKKIGRHFHGVLSHFITIILLYPGRADTNHCNHSPHGGIKIKMWYSHRIYLQFTIVVSTTTHSEVAEWDSKFVRQNQYPSVTVVFQNISWVPFRFTTVWYLFGKHSNFKFGVYHFIPVKKYQYYNGIFQK